MNMTGVAGVKAEEIQCVLDGDSCCEFSLSWNKSKTFQNFFTGISIWPVKKDVKEAIAEYEATLEQRDSLIEELISSEEKHRSVFENTATANAIVESDTSILTVNSEFENLIGYSKEEIEHQKSLKSFISERHHYVFEDYLNIKCDQIQCPTSNIELSIYNRDGNQKNVLCKMGQIPKTSQFVVSLMDITDSKRAQKEKEQLEMKLIKAEKMEAVGALAGGVAHDLNNILSGIVSYPDLLLLQLSDDSPHRNAIKTIQESGKKAAAIVQDMLTMARRGVVIKEAINLNDIVSEYLESPECEKLKSFHPDVRIDFRSQKKLSNMLGSPLHTAKAVMNLVSNAAEAMPSGGDVIITTKSVRFKEPHKGYEPIPKGNYVCLSVEDNGVGILPEDIDHIFEPFYTKKKMGRSGTGLGMAVVWGTVKDQKGYVDIKSILDEGTHFELYFPVSTDEATLKKPAEHIEIIKGNGESILVVDDVNEQLEIAGNILMELGYLVRTVQSGEDALKYLENNSVDLVILDMIMDPGIDGKETYRRINQLNPNQKVIIASGFSDSRRVKETQDTGAGSYLRKPYSIDTISKVVFHELKKPSCP
jgi:PAS domain S-box-containing protein